MRKSDQTFFTSKLEKIYVGLCKGSHVPLVFEIDLQNISTKKQSRKSKIKLKLRQKLYTAG